MMGVVRAELRRMVRWPAMWVLSGVWVSLNLTFGYLFPYLTYRSNDGTSGVPRGGTGNLDLMLPDRAPVVLVQGLPMFGGALVLVLGALAVGSGYGWGTWKTIFTTGPRRGVTLAGTLAAIGVVLAGLLAATLVADLATSSVIALAEHRDIVAPGLGEVLQRYGAALVIALMWTLVGVLLGALARGPALAVGLGLVWSLVLENLLRGVADLLGPLKTVTDVLPGTVAGSLAGAVGALPGSGADGTGVDGTPGVNTILDGRTAIALLAAYCLVFGLATLGLVTRRDVAG